MLSHSVVVASGEASLFLSPCSTKHCGNPSAPLSLGALLSPEAIFSPLPPLPSFPFVLETHLGNFLPLFCLPKLFYFCLVSFSKQVLNFTENRRNMGEIYSKCSGQAFLEIDNGRRRGSHSRGGLESKRSQSVPFLSLSH